MIQAEFTNEINDLLIENLYQWDTFQTMRISGIDFGSAPKVHFCNKKSTEALAVNGVLNSDGSVDVSIPNSLLTEKYDILAYIYTNTGVTSKTIKSITIPIISRLKPSEYTQPSDEDIAQIEAIELQAQAILNDLKAGEYSSTTYYKRPNIVYYNGDMYMAKNSTKASGKSPTNTTYWQLICKGSYLLGMSIDSTGNLKFTYKDGSSYAVPIASCHAQFSNITLLEGYPSDYATNGITKTGLYCLHVTGKASNGVLPTFHQCYLYVDDLSCNYETTTIILPTSSASVYAECIVRFNHTTAKFELICLQGSLSSYIASEYTVSPNLIIGG